MKTKTPSGNTCTHTTVEALIRTSECRHHVHGLVELAPNGVLLSNIDFGDGNCNNPVFLTDGGEPLKLFYKTACPKPMSKNTNHKGIEISSLKQLQRQLTESAQSFLS